MFTTDTVAGRATRYAVSFILLAALGPGCSRRIAPTRSNPASAPAPAAEAASRLFDRPDLGIRFEIPAGWVERPSDDYVLLLTSVDGGAGGASLSLDVPSLPPHIPGLIPVGSVRGGYLDDLKKAVGPLKTQELAPPAVPAASTRLVRSTWTDSAGVASQETALLLVHADRVYIVRARSLSSDEAATREAFDHVLGSLEWVRSRPATKNAGAPRPE